MVLRSILKRSHFALQINHTSNIVFFYELHFLLFDNFFSYNGFMLNQIVLKTIHHNFPVDFFEF